VATIQLGQDILAVESLIDERSHDEAFRRLVLARERFGRRPEFKYLQALFDATFQVRPDRELIREVMALVAEQPDFTEAVALLALLYERVGEKPKAEVFAREALHSRNPRALNRARAVLGLPPVSPSSFDLAPAHTQTAKFAAVASPTAVTAPPGGPTPEPGSLEAQRPMAVIVPVAGKPPSDAALRKATVGFLPEQPPAPDDRGASTLGLPPMRPPQPFEPQAVAEPPEPTPIETITFSPTPAFGAPAAPGARPPSAAPPGPPASSDFGAMEPEPVTPPEPVASAPVIREARTVPAFRPRATDDPFAAEPGWEQRAPTTKQRATSRPPPSEAPTPRVTDLPVTEPTPSAPPAPTGVEVAMPSDRWGPGGRPSRPAISIPPPLDVLRAWFKYARTHQVTSASGGSERETASTSTMLLDLAERVVEGRTPLSADPVSLDRPGLISVEHKLGAIRRGERGPPGVSERASVTAAAAYLLALLLRECDARATDTTPEDGACKALLPSGATVRPLLVAASHARGRPGPSLVETFDRAATSHMTRAARATTGQTPPPVPAEPQVDSHAPTPVASPLRVARRDLEAGTIAEMHPSTPPGRSPRVNPRAVAEEFWASKLGRELAAAGGRLGSFTLADVDALERHAARSFPLVGFAPPGSSWPWVPSQDDDELIFSWGAILGEVLVGLYAGRWEVDPGAPEDHLLFRVVLSSNLVAWPMAKVYLRLSRGVAHDLGAYVEAVGRIAGRHATRPSVF
jgi:hypothetical protein